MGEFRSLCAKEKMTELAWPARDYVVQVARFDPAKGIPNVIDSYARFRELLAKTGDYLENEMPQLLICGCVPGPFVIRWCEWRLTMLCA